MIIELLRQAKRRRTLWSLAALAALPVLLAVVLVITGPPAPEPGSSQPQFVDIATRSGLNFAFFVLAAASQLALVIVVALYCGDTVASEASWSSLRYLLVRPVARSTLLRVKLLVAVLYSLLAIVLLLAAALVAGTIAFGWHPLEAPFGLSLPAGSGLLRLLGATAYVISQLAAVGALAFLLSVWVDAPLGAVMGAFLIFIASSILDSITSLGVLRSGLPTHYGFAWTNLLVDPIRTGSMARGVTVQIVYTVLLLAIAWRKFLRKDILS